VGVNPLIDALSQQDLLDPIKLAYDPRCWIAGS